MICIIRSELSAVPKRWVGVILAESERCLWPLSGRPVLDHVIERAQQQVSSLIISTSGDPNRFAGRDDPLCQQISGLHTQTQNQYGCNVRMTTDSGQRLQRHFKIIPDLGSAEGCGECDGSIHHSGNSVCRGIGIIHGR